MTGSEPKSERREEVYPVHECFVQVGLSLQQHVWIPRVCWSTQKDHWGLWEVRKNFCYLVNNHVFCTKCLCLQFKNASVEVRSDGILNNALVLVFSSFFNFGGTFWLCLSCVFYFNNTRHFGWMYPWSQQIQDTNLWNPSFKPKFIFPIQTIAKHDSLYFRKYYTYNHSIKVIAGVQKSPILLGFQWYCNTHKVDYL